MYIRKSDKATFTPAGLRREYPHISFPAEPASNALEAHGIYYLDEAEKPAHDPSTQQVIAGDPVRSARGYRQTWAVVPLTGEQRAAQAKRSMRDSAVRAVRADKEAAALLSATPEQVTDYINQNVNDLNSAKDVMARLARVVSVLAQGVIE